MKKLNGRGMIYLVLLIVIIFIGFWVRGRYQKSALLPQATTQFLYIISADGLNTLDFDTIKELPNFKFLLEHGAYSKEMVGVYPSLTYPTHASVVTGANPGKHGIIANTKHQPEAEVRDWYWYSRDIKVKTLFDAANEAGLRTGAMLWPVTADADIDYLLPEIWSTKPGKSTSKLVFSTGSPLYILDIYLRYGKMLRGQEQPYLDDFVAASTAHMIRSRKPNLLLVHFTDLDHSRHVGGFLSEDTKRALQEIDRRIGELIQATKDVGIFEKTTFVVFGDHGFLDTAYKINLNTVFKDAGLLKTDDDGKITHWEASVNSCDGSAQVYLRNGEDAALREKVADILWVLKENSQYGIEDVFTSEEAKELGASGEPAFTLEAAKGYYFTDEVADELITEVSSGADMLAAHGYSPYKNDYTTLLLACGPGIREGTVLPPVRIIDLGPTFASLLGLKLPDAEGEVIDDMIYKE